MWETMRRMGGTNRVPRKRKLNVPLTECPDANEWGAHMAQDGKDGGCKATDKARANGELVRVEVIKLELKPLNEWEKKKG
jgi:hypothetical protein